MHDYAIDAGKRRKVNEVIVGLYVLSAFWSAHLDETLKIQFFQAMGFSLENERVVQESVYINAVVSILFPGIGVWIMYLIYDRWFWKCKLLVRIHGIPNLNGKWIAEVESPLKGGRSPKIHMEIKQTWNKLQVTGISETGTSTTSDAASLLTQNGRMHFSYSYWIYHEGGQCYPGFNSLRISETGLRGEYFSAKDVEDELERGCLHMVEEHDLKQRIINQIKGCGSKGIIDIKKVNM